MPTNQYLNKNDTEKEINFRPHMTKNNTFTEKFLASVLSISPYSLHKTGTLLHNSGEIMIYGKENAREYRLEDAYVLLTKYTKKEQIKALKQFKKEFFHE